MGTSRVMLGTNSRLPVQGGEQGREVVGGKRKGNRKYGLGNTNFMVGDTLGMDVGRWAAALPFCSLHSGWGGEGAKAGPLPGAAPAP